MTPRFLSEDFVRDSSVTKYDFAVKHKGTYADSSSFMFSLFLLSVWMMYVQSFNDKESKKDKGSGKLI